ncbi:hypothetical protein D9M68_795390 [compost metagenome]
MWPFGKFGISQLVLVSRVAEPVLVKRYFYQLFPFDNGQAFHFLVLYHFLKGFIRNSGKCAFGVKEKQTHDGQNQGGHHPALHAAGGSRIDFLSLRIRLAFIFIVRHNLFVIKFKTVFNGEVLWKEPAYLRNRRRRRLPTGFPGHKTPGGLF